MVEMVGVEVPAGEFKGVKRSVRQEMKRRKERNEKKGVMPWD